LKFFLFKKINKSSKYKNNTTSYLFKINSNLKNKNIIFSKNTTHLYIFKFINTFLKKGMKKKILLLLTSAFTTFFNFTKYSSVYTVQHLSNYIEMYRHNLAINKNLFFINFILRDIFNLLNPAFNLKLVIKNKKKRKKTKKKYTYQINYIFPEKRLSLVYKWINLYSNYFLDKSFKTRIFKSLFYTYIERRNSFLYQKKIEIYNQFIKSKKKKEDK